MLRRATIAASLVGLIGMTPVAAQEPAGGSVRVVSIVPWTDADHPFVLRVRVTNTTERAIRRLIMRVTFHDRVLSRSELRRALDERPQTRTLGTISRAEPRPIPPGEQRLLTLERPLAEVSPSLARTGVYPIDIVVSHAGDSVTLRSAVPNFSSAPASRLNLAWVQPVARPAAIRPDDTFGAGSVAGLAVDELIQQLRSIGAHPGTPLGLAPSGLLLDTLADLSDGFVRRDAGKDPVAEPPASAAAADAREALAAFRTAAAVAETIVAPYAPVDLPMLGRHGPKADLLRQVALGRATVGARVEAPADVFVPPGLAVDAAAAPSLEAAGVRSLVLDPVSLPVQPTQPFEPGLFGPSRPVLVRGRRATFPALLADQGLRARFATGEQGVLLAQAVLAETASAWNELPVRAGERLIVIAPEQAPSPAALSAALAGLGRAPWIRMRTPSGALRDLPPLDDDPLPLPRPSPPATEPLLAAAQARGALGVLGGIAVDELPEIDRLDRLVLTAESGEWSADPGSGASLARAVLARVDQVLRAVRVQPRQVTLTSRASRIPVTLLNGNDFAIRVRIRLDSPKVAFPAGDRRTVEVAPPDGTFDFEVEALGTGSFPLDVRIETPDGETLITRGRFTIRSTRVSAVTLAATGGSALFLLAAWLRRATRRRGARAVR